MFFIFFVNIKVKFHNKTLCVGTEPISSVLAEPRRKVPFGGLCLDPELFSGLLALNEGSSLLVLNCSNKVFEACRLAGSVLAGGWVPGRVLDVLHLAAPSAVELLLLSLRRCKLSPT